MLIGNIILTDSGIRIYDVDGSLQVEISADDVLDLAAWIMRKQGALQEIVRREQRKHRKGVQDAS